MVVRECKEPKGGTGLPRDQWWYGSAETSRVVQECRDHMGGSGVKRAQEWYRSAEVQ